MSVLRDWVRSPLMAGPGLLAHVLVSKFDDHLPLYRQNEIFARMGADIPASTLVDWCGQGMRVLAPSSYGVGDGYDAVQHARLLPALVQAEKWNGVLPSTMPPGGTVPFLNLTPTP